MAAGSTQTKTFQQLNPPLTPWVSQTIASLGFHHMTPVQAHTIPLFLQNKDVVVQAVTGSGKTLAFVIPIIERLLQLDPRPHSHVAAIIISPTRELATQTFEVINQFLETRPGTPDEPEQHVLPSPFLKAMLLIGGTGGHSIKQDLAEFQERGANILVATPGRLEEFLFGYSSLHKHKNDIHLPKSSFKTLAHLKSLEVLVLDEADRLLDLGFAPVLSNILSKLPKQRRTGLFSATLLNDGLTELIRAGLRNPVKVVVKVQTCLQNSLGNDAQPTSLINEYIAVPRVAWKLPQLIRLFHLLAYPKVNHKKNLQGARKLIVYFATCACVEYFYKILSALDNLKNFSIHSLHGQQSPTRRSITYTAFKNSDPMTPSVLLCTDLAARGLDLPDVDVVIQFDPPKDVRNFSHRIGRTARAGRGGRAIVLLQSNRELDYVDYLKIKGLHLQPRPYIQSPGQTNLLNGNEISSDLAADELNGKVKEIVKTDRALHDRGIKAFVSYVQFYSKHEASYIFQIQQLDLLSLAFHGFGLIKLPAMPELKKLRSSLNNHLVTPDGFQVGHDDFLWDNYAYLDPTKESQRQEKIREKKRGESKDQVVKSIHQSKEMKTNKNETTTLSPVTQKILDLESKKIPEKAAWSKKINAKISKEQKRLKRLRDKETYKNKKNNDGDDDGNGNGDGDANEEEEKEEGETDWKELMMEKKKAKKMKLLTDAKKNNGDDDFIIIAHDHHNTNHQQSSGFFDGLLG